MTTTPPKCRPHDWCVPVPGDVALTCDTCGLVLRIATTPTTVLNSIVNSIEQRYSEDRADVFRAMRGYGPRHAEFAPALATDLEQALVAKRRPPRR